MANARATPSSPTSRSFAVSDHGHAGPDSSPRTGYSSVFATQVAVATSVVAARSRRAASKGNSARVCTYSGRSPAAAAARARSGASVGRDRTGYDQAVQSVGAAEGGAGHERQTVPRPDRGSVESEGVRPGDVRELGVGAEHRRELDLADAVGERDAELCRLPVAEVEQCDRVGRPDLRAVMAARARAVVVQPTASAALRRRTRRCPAPGCAGRRRSRTARRRW